ncbi:hypothetical protein [Chitinophaga sp. MM2321]|uniref:hypothetical protein n=1 Tax=Chitinophaga sp. MM2321 TaxID=3137178 RepID=UPI0032D594A5
MKVKQELLPITQIRGTFFNVDVDERHFIKADDALHIISIEDMVYHGSHYTLDYDLFTQKTASPLEIGGEDVVTAYIPQLVEIAPAEMAAKYNISILDIRHRTDFDLAVDVELFHQRDQGQLPEMKVLGADYMVDMERSQLYHRKNVIPLSGFKPDFRHEGMLSAYLNKHTHQLVRIDPLTIKEMPGEEVVKVLIPGRTQLDPYYRAKSIGTDLKTYLMRHPLTRHLEAKIIPLNETNLNRYVKINQEKETQRKATEQLRIWHRKFRNSV